MNKKKKHNLLANILAAAAVICVLAGGVNWYRTRGSTDTYANKQKAAGVSTQEDAVKAVGEKAPEEESATAASTAADADVPVVTQEPEDIPIDFNTLWETCPEAYAWIRIPNTQIDYPVCQRVEGDQSFYLNHRADGVAEFAGAIYSENYNKRDFTDPNTVLYGHDMSNGSMFQNLHFYEDKEFFDKNREVTVYLPDKVLHYRVFAAYNTSDEHILLKFDCFKDPKVFKQYLKDILAGTYMYSGTIDDDIELTEKSRLLTLSTCNAYDNQRFVVQCVLE